MIARALIIALALRNSLNLTLSPGAFAFPLFDIGSFHFFQALSAVLVFFIAFIIVLGKDRRWIFLFLAFSTFLSWVSNYSLSGAFHPHVMILSLYMFFWEGESSGEVRRTMAVSFISAVFFSAAFFKINPHFLSGIEFTPRGNFFVFLGNLWLPEKVTVFLAWTVILLEFAVGILIWFRPVFLTQLILVSLLILGFLHPPVSFVYFCFLPFFLHVSERKWPSSLENPFLWFLVLALMKVSYRTLLENWYILAMSAFFLVVQLKVLFSSKKEDEFRPAINWNSFLPAGLVGLTALLAYLGAPSPLGYTMFAGLHDSKTLHEITLKDIKICQTLSRRLVRTIVSDVKFQASNDLTECVIKHPTESGARYVKRFICNSDHSVKWLFKPKEGALAEGENCEARIN